MDINGHPSHIHRNGHGWRPTQMVHICKIEWLRNIARTVMPFLDGSHPDSAEITQDDGYVSVNGLPRHIKVQDAGIQECDMRRTDLAQMR